MTDILERATKALEGVTEGPWFVSGVRSKMDGMRWLRVMDETEEWERAFIPYGDRTPEEHNRATANARFIAYARTGVPELVEEVKRLRDFMRGLRDAIRDNDMSEPVADNGMTVRDAILHDINTALKVTP